jgi:glycine C-acetyltransferase
MPFDRLEKVLQAEVRKVGQSGARKGDEDVICEVHPPTGGKGPRFTLSQRGGQSFLRMNSNSYLGLSLRSEVMQAEERATRAFGAGPGAVRFISGSYQPHVDLERRLAAFHGRAAGMIFSSAYATTMGVLPALITDQTAVISDELNHNCIINAMRLSRPGEKYIYRHLDLADLESKLESAARSCRRAVIVTDGIFSMRGDWAPLAEIKSLIDRHDERFSENAVLVVDDSHGVGAFGATGRGTEEFTDCGPVDVLVATLGKALGVNGGYVVGSQGLVDFLREKSAFYIYSNPITPGEAAAALASLEILDSSAGRELLDHLREMTARFEQGLVRLGFETIPGEHPVVPLMVRDTARTKALVQHLKDNHILATGLNFPVVPRGDEEIRFQISADHTVEDIDYTLGVLESFSAD